MEAPLRATHLPAAAGVMNKCLSRLDVEGSWPKTSCAFDDDDDDEYTIKWNYATYFH